MREDSNPANDQQITELNLRIEHLELVNFEYLKRIENLKKSVELTEEKFLNSLTYKHLVTQTQELHK